LDFKDIVIRFEKLHLFRRILLQKSLDYPLYPGQLHLLEFVSNHTGCSQSEVAEHLMISPASVALSTKRMEKSGLLEKRTDSSNLRYKRLYVTQKGINLSNRCRETLDGMDEVMFRGLNGDEINTLKGILDKLLKNLADSDLFNPEDMDFSSLMNLCSKMKKGRT